MTTAHRPTWNAAAGGSSGNQEGYWNTGGLTSRQFSARDLPSQLKLKARKPGQGTAWEVGGISREQMLEELATKEGAHRVKTTADAQKDNLGVSLLGHQPAAFLLKSEAAAAKELAGKYDDADEATSSSDDDSSSDSDDDEDETAELMRELEKIKAEREDSRLKAEAVEAQRALGEKEEEMARGNPLAAGGGSAVMKRKWNHDVVFKNQARDEPEVKKRFVNDTIRNDFHRKFLGKYIQ